ncbi:MAG: hypothetical protein HZT40_13050 [Candidatus Thiothrix singaporensis]|uniref:Doubled CXXCH motif domain-containing protein n=1 Tax=Candidatus Thiothrix singaporensis TaxID=2799669 RepID=A0A7L6ATC6_9GAMM|nr:MAG: hypothetical protein HZT40_13050 [Candidatus Thiothrix singaporensis]
MASSLTRTWGCQAWHDSGAAFQNNCLLCHAAIRTNRHKVNFLKADAIEKEGAADSDTCFGCHGGRAWYRISFPIRVTLGLAWAQLPQIGRKAAPLNPTCVS